MSVLACATTQVLKLSPLPRSFGGGTFAYAIRPRGARKLLQRAHNAGVAQPIDWFILQQIGADFAVRSALRLCLHMFSSIPWLWRRRTSATPSWCIHRYLPRIATRDGPDSCLVSRHGDHRGSITRTRTHGQCPRQRVRTSGGSAGVDACTSHVLHLLRHRARFGKIIMCRIFVCFG